MQQYPAAQDYTLNHAKPRAVFSRMSVIYAVCISAYIVEYNMYGAFTFIHCENVSIIKASTRHSSICKANEERYALWSSHNRIRVAPVSHKTVCVLSANSCNDVIASIFTHTYRLEYM